MLDKLKNNELIATLIDLKGNPKWSILTEPLWFIPFSLYSPFAALYMNRLGVNDVQIGILLSVGMILQVVAAFFGGIITDKMGRRKATLIFDFVSWSIPCIIWAFAQNFWWFLVAAIINSLYYITNISWTCLFIEDCPEKHIVNAFTLIQIAGMLSVFFSPLAIWLINDHSVVPVVRVLYIFSGISMTMKFVLLYIFGGETKRGAIRMEETRNLSIWSMVKEYKDVVKEMFISKKIWIVIFFMTVTSITGIASGSFFSLYITDELQLSDSLVAIFPMIRTVIMLIFVFGMQHIINRLKFQVGLIWGFLLYIASHAFLVFSPKGSIWFILIYTVIEAVAFAIVSPRREGLTTVFVDEKKRSAIYAVLNVVTIGLAAPFGGIVGYFASIHGALPFVFNIILFAAMLIVCQFSRSVKECRL